MVNKIVFAFPHLKKIYLILLQIFFKEKVDKKNTQHKKLKSCHKVKNNRPSSTVP